MTHRKLKIFKIHDYLEINGLIEWKLILLELRVLLLGLQKLHAGQGFVEQCFIRR